MCDRLLCNYRGVTFRLLGCCVPRVLLLLAFGRLGHACQDLWSPCVRVHGYTDLP